MRSVDFFTEADKSLHFYHTEVGVVKIDDVNETGVLPPKHSPWKTLGISERI